MVFNETPDFLVGGAVAKFIFAGEDGVISAWAAGSDATRMVDNSVSGAIYKGLAAGTSEGAHFLYATDFHNRKIDVFDGTFSMAMPSGTFADPDIPAGFAPFNIQNLGGQLYVTYARQDADKADDVSGIGSGYVDVFDTTGHLMKSFTSQGPLNSPWGLTMAPPAFGLFGNALLVGNFGDGKISAFDPTTGKLLGQPDDTTGNTPSIAGLWALKFGNGGKGGDTNTLYFTADIPGDGSVEDHGLFGSLSFAPIFVFTQFTRDGTRLTLSWKGGTPPYVLQRKTHLSDPDWTVVETVTDTTATVDITGDTGFLRVTGTGTTP